MNITILLSAVVAIVGLIVWFIATNPKVSEAGRLMYFAGTLAFCFQIGRQTLSGGT